MEGCGTGKGMDADAGAYGWVRRQEERADICCIRRKKRHEFGLRFV